MFYSQFQTVEFSKQTLGTLSVKISKHSYRNRGAVISVFLDGTENKILMDN